MKQELNCAMDIGEQMLVSGAEVHRVEDSVGRICSAFGAVRVDCFIITSSMVVTVQGANGNIHTQTRRISSAGTDFDRLDRLNRLSRRICSEQLSMEEAREELDEIMAMRPYNRWIECAAYALIAGSFALFFGGEILESLVAALIGCVLHFLVRMANRVAKNLIFSKFISSFFIAAMAYLSMRLGVVKSVDCIIIGNIMLLIPGIGFTNALRDLFTGDSIAGILRMLEAALSAAAIAAGYFVLVFLMGGVI